MVIITEKSIFIQLLTNGENPISDPKKYIRMAKITLIEPCIGEESLVTGELLLAPGQISHANDAFILFNDLCPLLKRYRRQFKQVKYHKKLGIIRFTYRKTSVIITQFGRITIRKAKSERQLRDILEYLIHFLDHHHLIQHPS
ncbi:MAG: hypothetical protein ACTSQQ_00070 [Candidatus Helarchaeota archaeon]